MAAVSEPGDFPEVFLALPPTFTFPLARYVLEYMAASTAFHIAIYRIDPMVNPPPVWTAELFDDWGVNVFPVSFRDSLSPFSHRSTNKQGLLCTYMPPEQPLMPLSYEWRQAFATFAYSLRQVDYATGDTIDDVRTLIPHTSYIHDGLVRLWYHFSRTMEYMLERYTLLQPMPSACKIVREYLLL